MDVQGFIDAASSYAYKQWVSAKSHVAPWDFNEVIGIIQSSPFKEWQKSNPNGTIDQYYIYLQNRQAYLNSPQYKIKNLEEQIDNMSDEVITLNEDLSQLKEEIGEKEDKIIYLEKLSGITLTTSFILMIVSCVLFYKIRKRN